MQSTNNVIKKIKRKGIELACSNQPPPHKIEWIKQMSLFWTFKLIDCDHYAWKTEFPKISWFWQKSNPINNYHTYNKEKPTCNNSSRTEKIGRYCLCSAMLFDLAKSLTASPFFICCENLASSLKSISPSSPTTAVSASICHLKKN